MHQHLHFVMLLSNLLWVDRNVSTWWASNDRQTPTTPLLRPKWSCQETPFSILSPFYGVRVRLLKTPGIPPKRASVRPVFSGQLGRVKHSCGRITTVDREGLDRQSRIAISIMIVVISSSSLAEECPVKYLNTRITEWPLHRNPSWRGSYLGHFVALRKGGRRRRILASLRLTQQRWRTRSAKVPWPACDVVSQQIAQRHLQPRVECHYTVTVELLQWQ